MDCCASLRKGIKSDDGSTTRVTWRADIDALMFWIASHSASCAVHRRAFRTLMRRDPTPPDCLAYFGNIEDAFRAAADAKITRNQIAAGSNLHLTSRDIARKLLELSLAQRGDDP